MKYTDDDIITAYGYCLSLDCRNCPLDGVDNCMDKVEIGIPEIYNRQKAEIKRLIDLINEIGEHNEAWVKDNHDLRVELKTAKAEAIKEFADRLKGEFEGLAVCTVNSVANKISNLVKEMTEDTP